MRWRRMAMVSSTGRRRRLQPLPSCKSDESDETQRPQYETLGCRRCSGDRGRLHRPDSGTGPQHAANDARGDPRGGAAGHRRNHQLPDSSLQTQTGAGLVRRLRQSLQSVSDRLDYRGVQARSRWLCHSKGHHPVPAAAGVVAVGGVDRCPQPSSRSWYGHELPRPGAASADRHYRRGRRGTTIGAAACTLLQIRRPTASASATMRSSSMVSTLRLRITN